MVEGRGLTFEVFLQDELAMRVILDSSLESQDVSDCLKAFEVALKTAEKEGFEEYGVFHWEIDGRVIRVTHSE